MKGLLLDQGLPRSTAELLRARGIEAVHVGECAMSQASDAAILERARSEQRAVVTLDADFHALLALTGAAGPTVIRLRAQGLKAHDACALIESVVARAETDIAAGALISATRKLVRIKRLPIAK